MTTPCKSNSFYDSFLYELHFTSVLLSRTNNFGQFTNIVAKYPSAPCICFTIHLDDAAGITMDFSFDPTDGANVKYSYTPELRGPGQSTTCHQILFHLFLTSAIRNSTLTVTNNWSLRNRYFMWKQNANLALFWFGATMVPFSHPDVLV